VQTTFNSVPTRFGMFVISTLFLVGLTEHAVMGLA
jgi:hypothetical protein